MPCKFRQISANMTTDNIERRKTQQCETRVLFENVIIRTNGLVTWRTPYPFWRARLWLLYNSIPKVKYRSVKYYTGYRTEAALCLSIVTFLICESLEKPGGYVAFISALFCCDVFCLLSAHEMSNMPAFQGGMMDSGCQPRMTYGPCGKLCHEPVSSLALQGGCCRSTSLTNVGLKMTRLALKPSQLSLLDIGCLNSNNQWFTWTLTH